jgi:hypothetical protein
MFLFFELEIVTMVTTGYYMQEDLSFIYLFFFACGLHPVNLYYVWANAKDLDSCLLWTDNIIAISEGISNF